jgi:hypothetical protein
MQYEAQIPIVASECDFIVGGIFAPGKTCGSPDEFSYRL